MGTIVGLIYLWLEYKASVYLWLTGIIMPAIYITVYYRAGLYADFAINIYYLLAALYGLLVWTAGGRRRKAEAEPKQELPISHIPMGRWPLVAAVTVAIYFAIAYVLINFTDSNVPWLDAFTTALSITGLWMLARKYIEQWWVWVAVDIVCCGLYIYKGLYFTSGLYGIYTAIAAFGYFKWKRLMKAGE
jgi:nicotinamide mononucleotide transporter